MDTNQSPRLDRRVARSPFGLPKQRRTLPKIPNIFSETSAFCVGHLGKEDQYYSPAAAIACKRDLPNAEVQVIDGGHWATESHGPEIIHLTRRFVNECYAVESVAA